MRPVFQSILLVFAFVTPAVSQSKVDSLLTLLPQRIGSDRIQVLTALCHELAFVNADSARMFGSEAASLMTDKSSAEYAEVLGSLAITYELQSNYEEALKYNQQALRIYSDAGDSLHMADMLNNIGMIYDEQGKYKDAISYYDQANSIYQEKGNAEKIALVALNLGVVYKGIGDYESSIANYRHALEMFSRLGNDHGVAVCNVNLGSVYLSLSKYDSALAYSLNARRMFDATGYVRFGAVATGNAGIALGKLGDSQRGVEYLKKAIELHKKNNAAKELSYCYLKLAELYADINESANALNYANKALDASLGAGVLQQVSDTHRLLALLYASQGDFRKAFEAHRAYAETKDSLYHHDKIKYVREFQVEYDTQKKERELAEARMKLTAQELRVQERNNQLILAGTTIVLIAVGGIILYRHQRTRQQRLELKAQLAEARTYNAIQEERLRISQELHDNIGSQLTFVNSSIETFKRVGNDERLTEIQKLTSSAVQELRKTVWLINKQSASVEEVVIKLREYFPSYSEPQIQFSAYGELDAEIPSSIANHMFRIVQEAVNNAIKHAKATHIQVKLAILNRCLSLTVSDNGIGFDPDAPSSGFGLRSIERRAKAVNGSIAIHSRPLETTISLSIPLV